LVIDFELAIDFEAEYLYGGGLVDDFLG
jgi:hypothetical protein